MTERYALFAGDRYYPKGGAKDFAGFFDSVEAATTFADSDESVLWDWAHVVRVSDMQIVKHFCDRAWLTRHQVWRDGPPNDECGHGHEPIPECMR